MDYDKGTLSIQDYEGNNVGILYAPLKNRNFAYDVVLKQEGNGWKELTFSINRKIDGKDNPLIENLANEYLVKVDDGTYKDLFFVTEPRLEHTKSTNLNVVCNHVSSRLRTKKLFLAFDDTNGIGKCHELISIILSGTGWTLGNYDLFYEPGTTTEKVRTLISSGKEGAYQLINKVCELFNARPVYNGIEKTVDILAFNPYTNGVANDPDSIIELNYSKAMTGVTRSLNTENLITRMYVEGEFGDDGYLGIEDANPTGMNFILNFDYFKANGLFKDHHQLIVDQYLLDLSAARTQGQSITDSISVSETKLMELWGTADYGIFTVTAKVDSSTYDLEHITSLDDEDVVSGQSAILMLDDGTHVYTKINTISGNRFSFAEGTTKTVVRVVIYRLLPSGKIGGKESAVEAQRILLDKLTKRTGDNLVQNSDIAKVSTESLVNSYTLSEDWETGTKYTVSVYGTANTGQSFRVYRDNGTTLFADLTYDSNRRCWIGTATCPPSADSALNVLAVYSTPSATATQASVLRVKLEFGENATPWSPAEDSSDTDLIDEYNSKIELLLYGDAQEQGIYALTAQAVQEAILLGGYRQAYIDKVEDINEIEEAFAEDMGDLLRDGYWQDGNYVVGQETSLYSDAVETLKVMSKPVAEYSLDIVNMTGMDAAPHINMSVNSPVHIIDDSISVNAWGYVDEVEFCLDMPYESSLRVSTIEAKFAGQSFTQVLSAIAETAKEVRAKQGIFNRSSLISKDGKIQAETLQGILNVETAKILSATSNWETDPKGNIVFTSQDRQSAMMLTGQGFMIASGKTAEGKWDWRTLGDGRGQIADEITAGTLRAGIVKILGTEQFFWDADNIYIFDPLDERRQIRLGRYDGVNYGIGFTHDSGRTWTSAFGFDGINLNYKTLSVSQITGMDDYLTEEDADARYESISNVGVIDAALRELDQNISQNIQFTAAGIIIQRAGSTEGFSSRFTSTALEFWQDAGRIAWFENRALHADDVVSNKRLQVGKLTWHVGGDNSVAVKWNT